MTIVVTGTIPIRDKGRLITIVTGIRTIVTGIRTTLMTHTICMMTMMKMKMNKIFAMVAVAEERIERFSIMIMVEEDEEVAEEEGGDEEEEEVVEEEDMMKNLLKILNLLLQWYKEFLFLLFLVPCRILLVV
jgi:hypothetical protein